MVFSILVVCLNAGDKLTRTVESILGQTHRDLEIIIKDGGSSDGSLQGLPEDARIRVVVQRDAGIYDAMNQAVRYAQGEYLFFLNCGDRFYTESVLEEVWEQIRQADGAVQEGAPAIYYGNIREERTGALVQSNPSMDDFGCYRNVPCHQACFYHRELLILRGFDLSYRVRADYEHFLWAYYRAKARTVYLPVTVAWYEGGGFSETRENERLSQKEHRKITEEYLPRHKVRKYRLIMLLTLSGVRTRLARSPKTAQLYNRIKGLFYQEKAQR